MLHYAYLHAPPFAPPPSSGGAGGLGAVPKRAGRPSAGATPRSVDARMSNVINGLRTRARVAWRRGRCAWRGAGSVACRAACALRWPAVIGWCRWPVLVDGGVLVRLRHAILVELGRTKYRPYRPARRLNVGMGGYWTTRVHDAKLEMRLPMALRASFDVACAAAGVSCSAQVRELMIAWLRSRPLPVDPPD